MLCDLQCNATNYQEITLQQTCPFDVGCSAMGCTVSDTLEKCQIYCTTDCVLNSSQQTILSSTFDSNNKLIQTQNIVLQKGYFCQTGQTIDLTYSFCNSSSQQQLTVNGCPDNVDCTPDGCNINSNSTQCEQYCVVQCTADFTSLSVYQTNLDSTTLLLISHDIATTFGYYCPFGLGLILPVVQCMYQLNSINITQQCPFQQACSSQGCSMNTNQSECNKNCMESCIQKKGMFTVEVSSSSITYLKLTDPYYCPYGFQQAEEQVCNYSSSNGDQMQQICPFSQACYQDGCSYRSNQQSCSGSCLTTCAYLGGVWNVEVLDLTANTSLYQQANGGYYCPFAQQTQSARQCKIQDYQNVTHVYTCPFSQACSSSGCSLTQMSYVCAAHCLEDCVLQSGWWAIKEQILGADQSVQNTIITKVDSGYYCPFGYQMQQAVYCIDTHQTNYTCPFLQSCQPNGCSYQSSQSACNVHCMQQCVQMQDSYLITYKGYGSSGSLSVSNGFYCPIGYEQLNSTPKICNYSSNNLLVSESCPLSMECYDGCSLQSSKSQCNLNCTISCEEQAGTWTVSQSFYNASILVNTTYKQVVTGFYCPLGHLKSQDANSSMPAMTRGIIIGVCVGVPVLIGVAIISWLAVRKTSRKTVLGTQMAREVRRIEKMGEKKTKQQQLNSYQEVYEQQQQQKLQLQQEQEKKQKQEKEKLKKLPKMDQKKMQMYEAEAEEYDIMRVSGEVRGLKAVKLRGSGKSLAKGDF